MDPFTAMMLIGTLASLGHKAYTTHKTGKYQKEKEAFAEKERKESEKKERRAALARAIGSSLVYAPKPAEKAPQAPDLTAANIIGALGELGAQIGAMGAAGGMAAPTGGAAGGMAAPTGGAAISPTGLSVATRAFTPASKVGYGAGIPQYGMKYKGYYL